MKLSSSALVLVVPTCILFAVASHSWRPSHASVVRALSTEETIAPGGSTAAVIAQHGQALDEVCLWDLDGDGVVGSGDLILLLGAWGDPYGPQDLIELLGAWGVCPVKLVPCCTEGVCSMTPLLDCILSEGVVFDEERECAPELCEDLALTKICVYTVSQIDLVDGCENCPIGRGDTLFAGSEKCPNCNPRRDCPVGITYTFDCAGGGKCVVGFGNPTCQ